MSDIKQPVKSQKWKLKKLIAICIQNLFMKLQELFNFAFHERWKDYQTYPGDILQVI